MLLKFDNKHEINLISSNLKKAILKLKSVAEAGIIDAMNVLSLVALVIFL